MSSGLIGSFLLLLSRGHRTCRFSPVFESFKDYVATEQLDGDNKYDAGEHGLQVRLHSTFLK